jgi:hypothetical protein
MMKLKLLIAAVVGLCLFAAAQNLGAQNNPLPMPDRNSSTLPPPNRDSSVLPPPYLGNSELPEAPPAPVAAESPEAPEPPEQTESGIGEAPPAVQAPAAEQAGAPAETEPAPKTSRWPWSLPRTGPYVGLMAGLNLPNYNIDDTDLNSVGNYSVKSVPGGDVGLLVGMDFGLLMAEAELFLSFDNAQMRIDNFYGDNERFSIFGMALHIPVLFKMDFHLGPVVLQPLLGPYFNIALGDLYTGGDNGGEDPYANPPVGLVFGGLAGLNLGRGILFIDGRYEIDLGKTVAGNDPKTLWRRSAFLLNLGYQIYLGRKK